jgi:tetratricopeptide (TPR) repeat protein
LAVLAAGALPLYRALSESNTETSAQSVSSAASVPTRLHVNADGSVAVSFQGKAGAAYQIYYAARLPASPDKAKWALIANDVAAGTNIWTDWLDVGAKTRSRAVGLEQGFYRVVLKPAPMVGAVASMSATVASADSTATNAATALKAMRKQETAEIMNIIADGPQAEATLVQKLADTPLTAEYILELLKYLTPEQDWSRKPILEAVVGERAAQFKPKALARARLLLGGIYSSAKRYPEAIQQFLEVARTQAGTLQGCEGMVSAGQIYQLQGNKAEARRYWQQAIQFTDAERWPAEAQLLLGLMYQGERNHSQALEEFTKLTRRADGGLFRAHGYFYTGEALRKMGRWEEAYAAYQKVIQLNRDLPRRSPFRSQYNQAEIKYSRLTVQV